MGGIRHDRSSGFARRAVVFACLTWAFVCHAAGDDVLRVGSKRFTESYILGEILTDTAARAGKAEHVQGLGNTAVLFAALKQGNIDLYPDYSGTIELEILHHEKPGASLAQLNRELAPMGLGVGVPFGFNNTYAIAMAPKQSAALGIKDLADLSRHPQLRFGISQEFLGRADGWAGLAKRYGLPQQPQALDHGIAYEALVNGQIDAVDAYSTDAKIGKYGLTVLGDSRAYFPRYDALVLYRLDAAKRHPQAWQAIEALAGRIDEPAMRRMNAAAELDGQSFAQVAKGFLAGEGGQVKNGNSFWDKLFGPDLGRLAGQHLMLVCVSTLLACIVGVPLGIAGAKLPRLGAPVEALAGLLQTIPSLALLAALIPVFGRIGTLPALTALFLYALLPIVSNTIAGLREVSEGLRTAALALGLRKGQVLRYVELPIASHVILAGVGTAAVISVGTATIAAFIGAGGFGERITIGLAVNDSQMLLAGAIPAAVLALLIEGMFRILARRLPQH
jgi:osmoprotectant transport system permease protein